MSTSIHRIGARSPGNTHLTHKQVTWFRVFLPTGQCVHDGAMARLTNSRTAVGSATRRRRHHRSSLRQLDRSALEGAGWRTTLEFRENHVRSTNGRLVEIDTWWVAEAERERPTHDAPLIDATAAVVVTASARSESRAWARLLAAAQSVDDRGHDGSSDVA